MTDDELRALLNAATPGPWKVCETTIHGRKYGGSWVEGPDVDDGDGRPRRALIPISGSGGARGYTARLVDIQDHDHNDANARLIAAAPALAAEVLRLRAKEAAAVKLAEAARPIAEAAGTWMPYEESDETAGARLEHPKYGLERHAAFTFGDLFRTASALAAWEAAHDPA